MALINVAGSLTLLGPLLQVEPKSPRGHDLAAVAGLTAFCFQTALLDDLVWSLHFRH